MSAANWHSQPDRDTQTFGHFDTTAIADDETRHALERIKFELEQLNRGCSKPVYHLRAECWMPNVTPVRYGYYHASFNETVLSAKLGGTRYVMLPDAAGRLGGYIEVVDYSGDAATTNITVKTLKGQTINGASTFVIDRNHLNVQFRSDGANWRTIGQSPATGVGDVRGPASATDNALARYDGTTGKLIQNSAGILDDTGNLSGIGTIASGAHTVTQATIGNVMDTGISTAGSGDSPTRKHYQNKVATSDATPTTLHTFATVTDRVYSIVAVVTAVRSTTIRANTYLITCNVRNEGDVLTVIAAQPVVSEDSASANATFVASGTNVLLQVTGVAGQVWAWFMDADLYGPYGT